MHVLLTGGAGFLGSACRELLAQRTDIRVSLLRSGCGAAISDAHPSSIEAPSSLRADDLGHHMKAHNITHIIHVGALSSPEVCEREPNRAYDSNVRFTEMLAEYATRVGVHLTTVSTDLVFDGSKVPSDGFIESDPPHSLSVYARSKLSAERITLRSPTHTVVRLALLYGHSESRSLGVLGWMEKALSAGAPLSLFGDEYRTPIHVLDAAHAVLQLSERALPGLWHCGGPTRLSRVEFGMLVAKALGYDASLILASSRLTSNAGPARPEDVSLNSEKLWTTLEMVPRGVLEALG